MVSLRLALLKLKPKRSFKKNTYAQDLRVGEIVEIRSEEEILATLDADGRLEALPFMPEMLKYCGKRARVFKRADKTCDTIENTGLRRMNNAVHLEGLRCDGESHGGCQAECLLFWKEAWLKRTEADCEGSKLDKPEPLPGRTITPSQNAESCTVTTLIKETRVIGIVGALDGETFSCQATELRKATSYLPKWDIRHYVRDIKSRNVGLFQLGEGMLLLMLNLVIRIIRLLAVVIGRCVIGRGVVNTDSVSVAANPTSDGREALSPVGWIVQNIKPVLRVTQDLLVDYPRIKGNLRKTPRIILNLQPGERVQVKTKREILETLDIHNSNRGLSFNVEMLPYCNRQFIVLKRVERIINEKTGKMISLPNDCIILEGVTCRGYYHDFCPRNIYPYWREIWLRKIN
jgi:hypothetical protein